MTRRSGRVAVIGGGVVGLSSALRLLQSGMRVTVISDLTPTETLSATAGALWFPFRTAPIERVQTWAIRTLAHLVGAASNPASGVALREGLVVLRHPDTDTSWTEWLDSPARPALPSELPAGSLAGLVVTLPIAEMPLYLQYLWRECERAGAVWEPRSISSLRELAGQFDAVVLAAGARSGALVDDDELFPIRGQVVRLRNPGIERWVLDEDNPAGITYVFPRSHDVVCGGSAIVDREDEAVDEVEEVEILSRVHALVPELADVPIVSRAVGLRPGRSQVRLEAIEGFSLPVVACYGHGGAGVTTSWGCAEEVADLVRATLTP